MALYIACNQLASIPWSIPFGEEQVGVMLDRARDVLNEFAGFHSYVPGWYLPAGDSF
ncbi:hypothetical protein D3C81_2226260 [compost metagenome]